MRTRVLVGAVAVLALTGCAATPSQPKPVLSAPTVQYDCRTSELVVMGKVTPIRAGQSVQVRVRSIEHPKLGVWKVVATNEAGGYRASGRYPITATPQELSVRLASVTQGRRVFAPTVTQIVNC